MIVPRKVKNSIVKIRGRIYYVPAYRRALLEGETIFVEEDGVLRHDLPKAGLRTDAQVAVYFPGRYDHCTNLLISKERADSLHD